LGIIAAGHTQLHREKIVNGDGGNDAVEVIGEGPEGAGTQEGTRTSVGGNTTAGAADPGLDQGFEVDASQAGVGGNTGEEGGANGEGARVSTRDRGWLGRGNP